MTPLERARRIHRVHMHVIDKLDFQRFSTVSRQAAVDFVWPLVLKQIARLEPTADPAMQDELLHGVLDAIFGLGPLEPALRDDAVSEIHITGPQSIEVTRDGVREPYDVVFHNDRYLRGIIERICESMGVPYAVTSHEMELDFAMIGKWHVSGTVSPAGVDVKLVRTEVP